MHAVPMPTKIVTTCMYDCDGRIGCMVLYIVYGMTTNGQLSAVSVSQPLNDRLEYNLHETLLVSRVC